MFRIFYRHTRKALETLKIVLYFLLYTLEGFAAFVALYFAFAYICLLFPISSDYQQKGELTEIYVQSNGVHCDLVIPIDHRFNWKEWIGVESFNYNSEGFLSIGWGDKGFYVDTPEWKDLKFSTAVRALFLNTETLMHLTVIDKPEIGEKCKSILIDAQQYQTLILTIQSRFVKDDQGNPILLEGKGYTSKDNFYEAHGSYSLFMTCNVWTNNVLKKIDVQTVFWAPFEGWVMKHL